MIQILPQLSQQEIETEMRFPRKDIKDNLERLPLV